MIPELSWWVKNPLSWGMLGYDTEGHSPLTKHFLWRMRPNLSGRFCTPARSRIARKQLERKLWSLAGASRRLTMLCLQPKKVSQAPWFAGVGIGQSLACCWMQSLSNMAPTVALGHWMLQPYYAEGPVARWFHGTCAPVKWIWWRVVELMFRGQFQIPSNMVPQDAGLSENGGFAHFMQIYQGKWMKMMILHWILGIPFFLTNQDIFPSF